MCLHHFIGDLISPGQPVKNFPGGRVVKPAVAFGHCLAALTADSFQPRILQYQQIGCHLPRQILAQNFFSGLVKCLAILVLRPLLIAESQSDGRNGC